MPRLEHLGGPADDSSALTPPCVCSVQEAAGEAGGEFSLLLPPGRGRGRAVGGAGGPCGPEAGAHGRVSRSPSEPCCWSAAEWPRKSPVASPSVSVLIPAVLALYSAPRTCLPFTPPGASICLGFRVSWGFGSFSCHSRVPSGLVPADVVLVSSPSLCLSRTGRGAASCTDLVCIAEAVCHREDVGRASEAKKRHLSQPSPLASIMVPFCKDLAVMSV